MYRHKIKSIVCLLGIVAAHKTFGLYKSFRNAFNPLGELAGELGDEDEENGGEEAKDVESNPLLKALKSNKNDVGDKQAEQLLKKYLKSDPMHLL